MNRRDAKKKSQSGELSIGELRTMIAERRKSGGLSKVNPAFPIERVCDIYEGALSGRPDDERPAGRRMDYGRRTPREIATRDSLTIYNILRDCAP